MKALESVAHRYAGVCRQGAEEAVRLALDREVVVARGRAVNGHAGGALVRDEAAEGPRAPVSLLRVRHRGRIAAGFWHALEHRRHLQHALALGEAHWHLGEGARREAAQLEGEAALLLECVIEQPSKQSVGQLFLLNTIVGIITDRAFQECQPAEAARVDQARRKSMLTLMCDADGSDHYVAEKK